MINNVLLMKNMMDQKIIRMESGPILQENPVPLPTGFNFERIEGMLVGLAIGDSLGNTTESKHPSIRQEQHGLIENYLPNHYAKMEPKGVPSDDTQMSFWTLEQLLIDGGLSPDHLAQRFCQEQIFGIGSAVKAFIYNYKIQKTPWQQAGTESAGNGALMRIAPILIPHLRQPSPALWADATLAGMVTHNDKASNAACVALIYMLWQLLGMSSPPPPDWWLETYIQVANQLEGKTGYESRMKGFTFTGPMWKFTQEEIHQAQEKGLSAVDACNHWGSGAFLLETIPSVIYILMMYGSDPEQAIIHAVNDTWDNDTVAAIVGAAVGALHGKAALPQRWLDNLLGRTGADDDGQIYTLIEKVQKQFFQ